MTTDANFKEDERFGALIQAAKDFKEAKEELKKLDKSFTVEVLNARDQDASWSDLMRLTGLPMGVLRQRVGRGIHLPKLHLEGHVGATEAGRILGVTGARVSGMSRAGEIEFKVLEGTRFYSVEMLNEMVEQRQERLRRDEQEQLQRDTQERLRQIAAQNPTVVRPLDADAETTE